uniref:Uncharacterized protein n=1 Tax=Paramormyrops kingsleyae TaxID=1676925 RepID=A0A3B3SJI8_9TELE
MEAEDRIGILKFVLMVISGIFVILGIAIFGCGVWILFDKSNFIAIIKDSVRFLSGGFFVIGLVVAAISLIGCLGALKEVRYFLLLVRKKTKQLSKNITKTLSDEVDKIIMDYGNGTNREMEIKWNILDTMQLYWTCCGRTNYTQWENNSYIKSCIEWEVYPCSCFNTTSCPFLSEDPSQRFGKGEKGCQTHMEEWIYQNGLVMLGMDLGLVLIQVKQSVTSWKEAPKCNKRSHCIYFITIRCNMIYLSVSVQFPNLSSGAPQPLWYQYTGCYECKCRVRPPRPPLLLPESSASLSNLICSFMRLVSNLFLLINTSLIFTINSKFNLTSMLMYRYFVARKFYLRLQFLGALFDI